MDFMIYKLSLNKKELVMEKILITITSNMFRTSISSSK